MPQYDVFVSHAWEDRDIARLLSEALQKAGLEVWFSGLELSPGDNLRLSIDRGTASSRYGVVIFSPAFLNLGKYWTQYELDALVQVENIDGRKAILPIWLNVDAKDLRQVSPALAGRLAILWSEGLDSVVQQILRVIRPVPKSQRRAALEHRLFDKLYHYEDATAIALRLVGSGVESFAMNEVSVLTTDEGYHFPEQYRAQREELIHEFHEEAASKHRLIFNGLATRLRSYQIVVPDPITEKKSLRLVLGPLEYFDFAVVRRLSDAALEDGGVDRIEDFVDIDAIAAGADLASNSLSNIVDTVTTAVSSDGYLLFVNRSRQVSFRDGWHTCAVAEGIQAAKDGIDFASPAEILGLPYRTVMRGISEELSPRLTEIIGGRDGQKHLRMLGMSFDLEGFHPDLIFLLVIPLKQYEIRKICREFPGVDAPVEGALRWHYIGDGAHDIVRTLATTKWTPGGAASVIRSLEYLDALSREKQLGSFQGAISWILAQGSFLPTITPKNALSVSILCSTDFGGQ
jgi:hypothetical protein